MKPFEIYARTKMILMTLLLSIPLLVAGQANSDNSMPQYLFPEFSKAIVKLKNGQTQGQNMNYNTVTEKMVFTKGDTYYDLTNPEVVDTIFLQNFRFVQVGKSFYQVLYRGKINLYLQNVSSLLPAGKAVGYGGTSQVASAEYVSSAKLDGMQYNLKIPSDYTVSSKHVYWMKIGDQWSDFQSEKQLLKLFPDKSGLIKDYMKSNKVKFDKPETMANLFTYINSL